MRTGEQLKKDIISDMRVELAEEFDKNFTRKAFFTNKWKKRRNSNALGSLLVVTGSLRRSIQAKETPDGVRFTSNQPHATLHNEGGKGLLQGERVDEQRFVGYGLSHTPQFGQFAVGLVQLPHHFKRFKVVRQG